MVSIHVRERLSPEKQKSLNSRRFEFRLSINRQHLWDSSGTRLPFMYLPNYRAWIIAVSVMVCGLTWGAIEKTKLGAYLRTGTENPQLLRAFGVNVPLIVTLTLGFGVALAGATKSLVFELASLTDAHWYMSGGELGNYLNIIMGAVFVICVLSFHSSIVGQLAKLRRNNF